MTTIFQVRVEAVEGSRVTLDVDNVYGWDWGRWLVNSRTLALHFLWDSLVGDSATTLGLELAGRDSTDEPWNRANVGRFVSCVGVSNRRHHTEMWNDGNHPGWIYPREIDRTDIETAKATYQIAVTDPRWLAHLTPGMAWNSTAYVHDEQVDFDPAWRTSTVLALAKRVDEVGDLSTLPILADALQDAGCTDPRILDHCRHAGPHVCGCWAVDVVLGGRFDPRVLDVAEVSKVDVEFWPEEEGMTPPPGATFTSPDDIALLLSPIQAAQQVEVKDEWALGTIRFTRRRGEALELLFYPGRNKNQYELRAAEREYAVNRRAFVSAFRLLGIALPLKPA